MRAQRIYAGHAHAVQAAGGFVAVLIKLAAGVQHGQGNFEGRLAEFLVDADGNTAAVILD